MGMVATGTAPVATGMGTELVLGGVSASLLR